MNRTLGKILATGAIGLASLLPINEVHAQEEKNPIKINFNLAFGNRDVAVPGFILEEEPVIQPSVSISKGGLYGKTWLNFNSEKGLSEIDYIVGYGGNVKGWNFDASYNVFDLRDMGKAKLNDNLHEFWLNFNRPGIVSPSLTFVQNLSGGTLENERGNYAIFSLNHKRTIKKIPISVDFGFHYSDGYFTEGRGPSIAHANLSLPFKKGDVSITPQINVRRTLDKDNFENSIDWGLSLNYTFNKE